MKKFFLGVIFFFCFFVVDNASAATLFVNPGSGSFNVGSTFTVSVRTNTQGEPVNTAEANITYSTDTLELVSVSQGANFYLPAPGSPSRGSGTAYFGGGLPSPGYNGVSGIIGSMTFRARAVGTATVSVTSGKVLLNDGQGTNALNGTSNARFTITPPPVGSPEVTSTTHPDPTGWSAKDDVILNWSRPTGAYGFSFELDQKSDTTPDNQLDTTITTTKTYENLADGTWYFHIKSRGESTGFGNTTHFRIGVDTQKPLLFEIKLVGQEDLKDVTQTPTITFEATDELSGIDYYSVFLDGEVVEEKAQSPFSFSKIEKGPHLVRITAFDKAGNDRKAELPIIVSGPPVVGFFQRNLEFPLYLLLLINLVLLVLIILILKSVFKKKKNVKNSDAISDIQSDIDQSLDDLKQRLSQRILNLTAETKKELASKERIVADEVKVSVTKAKTKIDKRIGKLRKTVKRKSKGDEILT